MAIKIDELILTEDKSLLDIKHFDKVLSVLKSFKDTGTLARMSGNCIGACEMLGIFFQEQGIKTYTTEVQVFIKNGSNYAFVGFDSILPTEQIDTHTVLVILLEVPIILDLSIPYALTEKHPIILERLNGGENADSLGKYEFENLSVTYQAKKNLRLPNNLQKSLLHTLLTNNKTSEKVDNLKILLYITAAGTIINFTLNMILVILKINFL
jgi:hypothetical protein